MIEYEAVDLDMLYIIQLQDEMHECYREKTKEIVIDIC